MYKENYLAAFIDRLNTYQVIYTTPFLVLYEYWFTEVRDLLHNEIDENLLLLATEKHKKYLEIVLNKIKKNIIYMQNSLILDKWIEKYDLSKYEFPFLENKEVEQILATSISQDNLDYDKKKIATNMQIDFYSYTAMIEAQKMIEYIDSLLTQNFGVSSNFDLTATNNNNAEENKEVVEQINKISSDVEQSSLNDFTRSTIVEYLEDIIEDINPGDYGVLVDALYCYFTTFTFPKLERKIIFKKVNKKKVGWALKEVYKNLKTDNLGVEYFRFAQENINLFDKEIIITEGFLQSKFYKAFTTNPAK